MRVFFKDMRPFGQLVTLVVAVVLLFIVFSGVIFVAAMCGVDVMEVHTMRWLQLLSQLFTFLLPALLFAWLFSDSACAFLRLDFGRRRWTMAVVGVVVLCLLLPLNDWLTTVNDNWHWSGRWAGLEDQMRAQGEQNERLVEAMLSLPGFGNLLVNLLVVALVPAICEELFFRGALQQLFVRWFGNPHAAIPLTAAVFSLMHGELFAFLPRFMLGLLLGYMFYYGGSMLVNVLMHFCNNAAIVVIYYLFGQGVLERNVAEEMNLPAVVVALCTVAGVALAVWALRKEAKNAKIGTGESDNGQLDASDGDKNV